MDLVELKQRSKKQTDYRHPWERARLKFVLKKLKQILVSTKGHYTFLDIGSGDTFLAEALSKTFKNSKFHCVDTAFTDKQLDYFNSKYKGSNVYTYKNTDSLPLLKKIDIVLLLDVLEHIDNDHAFLNELYSLANFNKNTKLLITVPAFQSLFTQHDIILGHYRRYTNKTLSKVIEAAKFSVEKKGYFFSSLLLPRYIEKHIERLKSNPSQKTGISNWSHGKFITEIFTSVLIIDYKITSILETIGMQIIGLSNYAICKKKY